LLQQLNRDTQKFAFKTSAVTINGEDHPVYKDPVEGHEKVSKRGRMALRRMSGRWSTQVVTNKHEDSRDLLRTVFKDGEILVKQKVSEIRELAHHPERVSV